MAQHIGNAGTGAMAWVRYIMPSLIPRIKQSEEPEKFTERARLLSHGLTYVNQQDQSQRPPQQKLATQDSSQSPAALTRSHTDVEMVLTAPAQKTIMTSQIERKEAQAHASEQLAAKGLAEKRFESAHHIDTGEVADRVYRLMQYDLILERERATKLGG